MTDILIRNYDHFWMRLDLDQLDQITVKKWEKLCAKLLTLDGNDGVDAFGRGETVTFDVDGTEVTLSAGDVLTEPMQKPGFVAQEDRGVTVVLDTNLTEALISEGFVREVVSKLQNMRKDAGYEVTDRIDVRYTCGERLAKALAEGGDMVKKGTLAVTLERAEADESFTSAQWNINGEDAVLAVRVHA